MKLRGASGLRITKQTPRKERNEVKKKIDPDTGLTLISRGWYDEIVPPPVPSPTKDYGATVESILAHAHYLLVKDWMNPNGTTAGEQASLTYGPAIVAGFVGHMGQWLHNVLAGQLRHGTVDLTPRKVRRRLQNGEISRD